MGGSCETITVAAGQIAARLMNEATDTLASIEAVIEQAARRRVDLLVLPECAYPAYLLGSVTSYRAGDHLSGEAYVAWLSEQARRRGVHIISGFVEDSSERLHNAAVLIDDKGREVGRARKRFLWHADHEWYAPGREINAFDTALGRIGIIICAEARAPEIMATLVSQGAQLIAMPTCWVNHSREPGRFINPQVDYFVEARAREFGVPLVCADKWGVELPPVGYVGQSRIVRADGSVAAQAPSEGDSVVAARLPLRPPRKVWASPSRRDRVLAESPAILANGAVPRRVTVAAMPAVVANERFAGGMGESLFKPLRDRGVGLLLVNMLAEANAEQLSTLARAYDMHAIGFPHRADVHELGPARIGCVPRQWAGSFVTSRALALDGAEVLMFFDAPEDAALLRTRAAENRVFVMATSERWAGIIGTDGEVLAWTSSATPSEAVAEIDLLQAANKKVAPDTDIFEERHAEVCRF